MKNIKPVASRVWKIGKWVCALLLAAYVLVFSVYTLAIWASLDFNPHFMEIESCMDAGGVWDYDINECDGAPER
ncbi:MAG: hypothetical protein IT559_06750 [Alphaproteobacteria bacterium]|nr:hypothetical protein [Alphaproteobacteria bacterium]